jgi:hypothetical protein
MKKKHQKQISTQNNHLTMKKLLLLATLCMCSLSSYCTECNIEAIYKGESVYSGTMALDSYGNIIEIEMVLEKYNPFGYGEHTVRITKISDGFYKIDSTDYYIKTSSCGESAYGKDVTLVIKSNSGYNIGEIKFDD